MLAIVVARAFWTVVGGLIGGIRTPQRRRGGQSPEGGVRMVRDPVCGTFLPPSTALAIMDRDGAVRYFCSETCRDTFKSK